MSLDNTTQQCNCTETVILVCPIGEQGEPRGTIVTHQAAYMSMVQSQSEGLGEGISRVSDPGNVRENNLAMGFPLLNCKMLNVDVTGPGSRTTSIDHEDCGSVVFVQGGRLRLWIAEFREDGAKILGDLSGVHGSNQFSFGRTVGNCRLDGAAAKHKDQTRD